MNALHDMLVWLNQHKVNFSMHHAVHDGIEEDVHSLFAMSLVDEDEYQVIKENGAIWSTYLYYNDCIIRTYGCTLHKALERMYNEVKRQFGSDADIFEDGA